MFISWKDEAVRLTGRWSRNYTDVHDTHKHAQETSRFTTTTAAGSYFELAFEGRSAVLAFDLGLLAQPYPHLWISVDNGARIEVPVDRYLRVEAPEDGVHVVKVVYKGGVEMLPG